MMKLRRRRFVHLAAGAVALPASSLLNARAQAYPSRPVRLVVGVAAGGSADLLARLMGRWLSGRLGQQSVIEYRPTNSNISAATAIRGTRTGYTLLACGPANAINAMLYDKLNFNFVREEAPVGGIASLN